MQALRCEILSIMCSGPQWTAYPGFKFTQGGNGFTDWALPSSQSITGKPWKQDINSDDRSNCIPLDQVHILAPIFKSPWPPWHKG
jgi:hypothetical protein